MGCGDSMQVWNSIWSGWGSLHKPSAGSRVQKYTSWNRSFPHTRSLPETDTLIYRPNPQLSTQGSEQPGTCFNWMRANPSITELRKPLRWAPSSPTPSEEQSECCCFDFLLAQLDTKEPYHYKAGFLLFRKVLSVHWARVPCHWPTAFSNLRVCILCLLDKADHVTPSFVKHLLL